MSKTRWEFNMAGFAELRNHPNLVSAMQSTAESATTDEALKVQVWPHQGRKSGPRTSVQVWGTTKHVTQLQDTFGRFAL